MADNNPGKSRKFAIPVLVSALSVVVAAQAWYMADMKQQLDTLKAPAQLGAAQPGTAPAVNAQTSTNQVADNQGATQSPPDAFADDFFNRGASRGNWNPYEEFQRMQREIDERFNRAFGKFNDDPSLQKFFSASNAIGPDIDVKDEGMSFVVLVDLPGADRNSISVNLDDQQLSVSAQQNYDEKKTDNYGNVIFRQHHSGSFTRSITLPEPVKPGSMHTEYANGVLKITISKVT